MGSSHLCERGQEGSRSSPHRTFYTSAGDKKLCTLFPPFTHSASWFAAKEQRSKALWQLEHRHNRMASEVAGNVTKSSRPGDLNPCPESLAFKRLPGPLCCSPTLVAIVPVALSIQLLSPHSLVTVSKLGAQGLVRKACRKLACLFSQQKNIDS